MPFARSMLAAAGLLAALATTTPALAAPCAGFSDVDDGDGFCANVEWIKNRGVTQGCEVGLYCPAGNVTRLQMAAFLNRLGEALHPTFLHEVESRSGGFNNSEAMCVTAPYVVEGFPRIATGTGTMYFGGGSAPASRGLIRLAYSVNNGASWAAFANFYMPADSAAGKFASATSVSRALGLDVGTTVRFAIINYATGNAVTDAGCEIRVRIEGRGQAAASDALPGEKPSQQQ